MAQAFHGLDWLIDWVKVLRPTWHKIGHFGDVPSQPISWLVIEKLNLTQQKHTFTNQKKCTTTQNKHKKTKARFSRLLWHQFWKRTGPFLVSVFHKLVIYLLRHIPTYLQLQTHTRLYRLDFLPLIQPAVSKDWRKLNALTLTRDNITNWLNLSSSTTRRPRERTLLLLLIIINDSVYGAVLMTMVTARVHPVHLMNADWAPGGRQPSDQANRLWLWVHR